MKISHVVVFVFALVLGAAALYVWQARKTIAAISGHKKAILDIADLGDAASRVFDDAKEIF